MSKQVAERESFLLRYELLRRTFFIVSIRVNRVPLIYLSKQINVNANVLNTPVFIMDQIDTTWISPSM